jgi:uncharacterized protein YjcR
MKQSQQSTIDSMSKGLEPSGQIVFDLQRAGAPRGNKNAWKHGFHSKQAIAQRRQAKQILIESKGYLKGIRENDNTASLLDSKH